MGVDWAIAQLGSRSITNNLDLTISIGTVSWKPRGALLQSRGCVVIASGMVSCLQHSATRSKRASLATGLALYARGLVRLA